MNRDDKYYAARERSEAKRDRALAKGRNRIIVAAKWRETNVLNAATLADFKKTLKEADREWERNAKKMEVDG